MKYFKKDPITRKPVKDRALIEKHIIDYQAKKETKIGRLFTANNNTNRHKAVGKQNHLLENE